MSIGFWMQLASASAALAAAVLWWRASAIETPPELTVISVDDEAGFGGELPLLLDAVKRQSFWNVWAARAAALSAGIQAVAMLVGWLSNQ